MDIMRLRANMAGSHAIFHAIFKEVNKLEQTTRFYQEIYDQNGNLIEIHIKYPEDEGHKKIFGAAWEDCENFLQRLGYRVDPHAADAAPAARFRPKRALVLPERSIGVNRGNHPSRVNSIFWVDLKVTETRAI